MENDNPCKSNNGDCEGSFGEIFELIDRVGKKLMQIQRQTIKETKLTPPQYFVLTSLWQKDGQPLKDLAALCHCSRATMTGIVDSLEKKNLAVRQPNPDDRRSLLVTLTNAGKTLKVITPTLEGIFNECCYGLEPEEFLKLGMLLTKLEASLPV